MKTENKELRKKLKEWLAGECCDKRDCILSTVTVGYKYVTYCSMYDSKINKVTIQEWVERYYDGYYSL